MEQGEGCRPNQFSTERTHASRWRLRFAANLFNGMVAPLMPYAIKGVIWYQGESNGDNMQEALEYPTVFARLIKDWHEKWAQGQFSVPIRSIAQYECSIKNAVGRTMALGS